MPRPARRESLMPGGGLVFNQVHYVMADLLPENVVAMLDAAFEFGEYWPQMSRISQTRESLPSAKSAAARRRLRARLRRSHEGT